MLINTHNNLPASLLRPSSVLDRDFTCRGKGHPNVA